MTTLLAYVFVLGVLIFVHELGHFMMARRIGVRVLTFSLGFGPKLVAFRRGDTEYRVSAIPLGGYVKMAGESPEESRTGASDEFLSKSKWQRFQVLIMGPVMNLLLAVGVMTVVLYHVAEVPAYESEPVIVGTVDARSVAAAADVRPGDRITSVAGEDIANWERFSIAVASRANQELDFVIRRGGLTEVKRLVPQPFGKYEFGDIGVKPLIRPQILRVTPDEPAARAGLQPHDVIVGINGQSAPDYDRLIADIRGSNGRQVTMEIERAGGRQTITVTPRLIEGKPRIGADISRMEMKTVSLGAVDAFKMSVARNWEWSTMIAQTIAGLVTGDTSVKQLMGPVAIADLSGTAAALGWAALFSLMSMLSLNLGLLNLLPIPVLDGGHIAILAMEGISRRDFSLKVKEKMLLAGFVFLLMLMGTVIYNDLTRVAWISHLMPWR